MRERTKVTDVIEHIKRGPGKDTSIKYKITMDIICQQLETKGIDLEEGQQDGGETN